MNIENLQTQIDQCFQQLIDVVESQEPSEMEILKLGNAVLQLINEYLQQKPNDMHPRFLRLRTQNILETNAQTMLEEAKYIVKNATDDEDVNSAYNWISLLYEEKLAMPEKAIAMIEEQLIEIHTRFKNKIYRRDEIAGYLLNKMAILKRDNGNAEDYLDLAVKSFEKYPYIHERNGYVGLKLLEEERLEDAEKLLTIYFDWVLNVSDEYIVDIGKLLKTFIDQNKLAQNPNLIGLYYYILRNFKNEFSIKDWSHFNKLHLTDLLKWVEKYPNNTWFWQVVGNSFYFVNDYKKALSAYLNGMKGDGNNTVAYIDNIYECCIKTKYDFFSIPFKINCDSQTAYNVLTTLYYMVADKPDEQISALANRFGEYGYQQYRNYLINGEGSTYNNQPHMFAMLCNNYGLLLKKTIADKTADEQKTLMAKISRIHWEGYQISPFQENIENAIEPAFVGELYEDCIKYADIYLNEYANENDDEDEEDIEDAKRTKRAAAFKLAQLKIKTINSVEEIKVPKIFSDSRFSDEASWQAQTSNFKKLFELLKPEYQNLEYERETSTELILEWEDYKINFCSNEINENGQTVLDNIVILNDDGCVVFGLFPIEKSKGLFGFGKKLEIQLQINLLPKQKDDYTLYQFGLETELLQEFNRLWAEILHRAELGNFYMKKFKDTITAKKIISYLNLPVVQEQFTDFWDSDKMGFKIADTYSLIFCHNGAENDGKSYAGQVVVGVHNLQKADQFDLKKFYFKLNAIENPTYVYLTYLSSQEGKRNDRYNNNMYVPSIHWEMYKEALDVFADASPFIDMENENYLNEKRQSIEIKGKRLYSFDIGDVNYQLLSRVEAEAKLNAIKDFNNNVPLDIFKLDFPWQGNRAFLDEYFLFCDTEIKIHELNLNFQPDEFNIIGYIFEKNVEIETTIFANKNNVVASFIALARAETLAMIADGGVHYVNENFNCNLIAGKNNGQLIVKEKLIGYVVACENFELQLGDFNVDCFEDYRTHCIKVWGDFKNEKGETILRELYPFPPTNDIELLVDSDFLEQNSCGKARIKHSKSIDFYRNNKEMEVLDTDRVDEYLQDFDKTLTERVNRIFNHPDVKRLKKDEVHKIDFAQSAFNTYYYFAKDKNCRQIGFWNVREHYIHFATVYNNGKVEYSSNFYDTENQMVRFAFSTKAEDALAITHAGKRMLLEAEDVLQNENSKLRKAKNTCNEQNSGHYQ